MDLLHIVFGPSSVPVLAAAIDMDEKMKGEILFFEDDLSIGPLFILDTKEGQAARLQWQQQLNGVQPVPLAEGAPAPDTTPEPGDADRFAALKARLKAEPEQEVWIWAGQNARDVTGYYWLITQLYDFAGRIHIIYLNNLPFLNEKGAVFYPTHLEQILPKEFLKAKKLARAVSLAEFELDGDEWHRLMNENAGIRILEGGKKLRGEPAALFDKELLQQSGKDFQKAFRVVNQVTGKLKFPVPDIYLAWRIRELVKAEELEVKGDLQKTIRDYEIKLPGNANENAQ